MGLWAILEGNTGRLCILPVGALTEEKRKYGRFPKKVIACSGLMEAVSQLKEYETQQKETKKEEVETDA